MALSNGECEFVAIVKSIVIGPFAKNLLDDLGWCITGVRLVNGTKNDIEARSRETIEHLETKSLFPQHLIMDGLVMLETVHTKVNTAVIDTKYLDAPTVRKLIGLLDVRQLTLDGAEGARCESTHHAQS